MSLPEARRDVYDSVRARAREAMDAEMNHDSKKLVRHIEFLRQHKLGQAEYSMAGRSAIALYVQALQAQVQRLASG
jgi:hypothetical protein